VKKSRELIVVFIVALTVFSMLSVSFGQTGYQTSSRMHSAISSVPPQQTAFSTVQSVPNNNNATQTGFEHLLNDLNSKLTLLEDHSKSNGASLIGATSASVVEYSVSFNVANKAAGAEWSVYIYTNLSLEIPDLPLFNAIYHNTAGFIYSSNSTSSTITATLPAGTYYYYYGPSPTLIGPYELNITGTQSVTVTFPLLYQASFTEKGLSSGSAWNVFAAATQPDGKIAILSEKSSTMTVFAYLPNGYYSFGYGSNSLVIETYSFAVSGSSLSEQVSFPALTNVTFIQNGLNLGTRWEIVAASMTQNSFSFYDLFINSSSSLTIVAKVPQGAYFFEALSGHTSLGINSELFVGSTPKNVSVNFPSFHSVTFTAYPYIPGVYWQVSLYSVNGTVSSSDSSYSPSLVLDLPTGAYIYTAGIGGASLESGKLNITTSTTSISITLPQTFRINIDERGLSSGMQWGLTVSNSSHNAVLSNVTIGSSLSFYLPTGKYNYTLEESTVATALYDARQSITSTGSFSVSGNEVNISVSFPLLIRTNFTESSLSPGLAWGVTVYSSTTPSGFSEVFSNTSSQYGTVSTYLINGTFFYNSVVGSAYFHPNGSEFNVSGTEQIIQVHFPSLYNVTFSVTGFVSPVVWNLNANNVNYSIIFTNSSSSSTMTAYLPNGTYNYTFSATSLPSIVSSFTVSGSAIQVPIAILSAYLLTFSETGLVNGTLWYVLLNGRYHFSSNSTVQIAEFNGTYNYSVAASGYVAVPSNGTVTVSGKPTLITIKFTPTQITYSLTFSETGLPVGTTWSLIISGSTKYTTLNSITVQEPNGTYYYQVSATGYSATPQSGIIVMKGSPLVENITFSLTPPTFSYTVAFSESGLQPGTSWSVTLSNITNSGKIIATIYTSTEKIYVYGIALDSVSNYLYAAGYSSNLSSTSGSSYPGVVVVINAATNSVVTTISVGSLPEMALYDPSNGYVYTANTLSNNISVINTVTNTVIATISDGSQPVGLAYDSANQHIYVTNGNSNSVSVINTVNNSIISTIPVGAAGETLTGVVYDPSNSYIYVGSYDNSTRQGTIYVVSTTSNSVVDEIQGIAFFGVYDPSNGYIYFTDHILSSVLVIDGATDRIVTSISLPPNSFPFGICYDSFDKYLYVAEENSSSLAVISSENNNVVVSLPVTGYPLFPTYDTLNHDIYVYSNAVGGIQVITSYGGLTSTETSSGGTIQFSVPNGTYSFSIVSPIGYSVSPTSGTLTVKGSNLSEPVKFSAVATYEVTFVETGLTSGTSWSVTLGTNTQSSSSNSIHFEEPNGSYSFTIPSIDGYNLSPGYGVVTVDGQPVTQSVVFSKLYQVIFEESGLANGTLWSVTVSGLEHSSNSTTITFNETNGSYVFTVTSAAGYSISPSNGTVTVNGAPVTETILFSTVKAAVYLTGTISPANASLFINGKAITISNGQFNVSLQPGSYEVKVVAPGYNAYYYNLTVSAGQKGVTALNVALTKQAQQHPLPLMYIVAIIVIIILAVAIISVVLLRSRRKPEK